MTVPTIRVDELQRWTLLLDHLAHWLSRADGVTCDHYQGFAATSCSYRDSDLLDMVFALTGIICRLDEVVEGAGVITTATPTSMVVTLQAHEAKEDRLGGRHVSDEGVRSQTPRAKRHPARRAPNGAATKSRAVKRCRKNPGGSP